MDKQATDSAAAPETIDPPPSSEPLLLRAAEAAAPCSVSVRTWRAWDIAGRIPQPMRIGRTTLWRREEIAAWPTAGCPDRQTWQTLRE